MGLTKTGDLIQPLLAGPFKDPETETFVRLTDPTDHPLQIPSEAPGFLVPIYGTLFLIGKLRYHQNYCNVNDEHPP